jgi:hypothetical protein
VRARRGHVGLRVLRALQLAVSIDGEDSDDGNGYQDTYEHMPPIRVWHSASHNRQRWVTSARLLV